MWKGELLTQFVYWHCYQHSAFTSKGQDINAGPRTFLLPFESGNRCVFRAEAQRANAQKPAVLCDSVDGEWWGGYSLSLGLLTVYLLEVTDREESAILCCHVCCKGRWRRLLVHTYFIRKSALTLKRSAAYQGRTPFIEGGTQKEEKLVGSTFKLVSSLNKWLNICWLARITEITGCTLRISQQILFGGILFFHLFCLTLWLSNHILLISL